MLKTSDITYHIEKNTWKHTIVTFAGRGVSESGRPDKLDKSEPNQFNRFDSGHQVNWARFD